ncbi:MAG: hypothetical protein Q8M66_03675 [Actinomycetota bacterium]|nr:hypothetical protein [Actinomycetota bacterium]
METTPQIPLSQVEVYGALRYPIERMAFIFGVTPAHIADLMADTETEFSKAYDTGRKKADAESLESLRQIEQSVNLEKLKSDLFGL